MATTLTVNGSVTLDDLLGCRNSGTAAGSGYNNDNDVSLATLQANALAFYNRLFNTVANGGLNLATTFPTANGVAQSASNFVTVSSGGSVVDLGFSSTERRRDPGVRRGRDGDRNRSHHPGRRCHQPLPLVARQRYGSWCRHPRDGNHGRRHDRLRPLSAADERYEHGRTASSASSRRFRTRAPRTPMTPSPCSTASASARACRRNSISTHCRRDKSVRRRWRHHTALVVIGGHPLLKSDGTSPRQRHDQHVAGWRSRDDRRQQPDVRCRRERLLHLRQDAQPELSLGVADGLDQNEADDADAIISSTPAEPSKRTAAS